MLTHTDTTTDSISVTPTNNTARVATNTNFGTTTPQRRVVPRATTNTGVARAATSAACSCSFTQRLLSHSYISNQFNRPSVLEKEVHNPARFLFGDPAADQPVFPVLHVVPSFHLNFRKKIAGSPCRDPVCFRVFLWIFLK